MKRPGLAKRALNATENCILNSLAQKQFAVPAQLAVWCGVAQQNISIALKTLDAMRLIETGAMTKPAVWRLTHAGGARMRSPMPSGRRHSSWSVMQNAVHRNAAEILLAQDHPGFHFLTRLQLYKKGFNPSHGEYAGIDDKGTTWLVLIDDFMMESKRIAHHWTRMHRPPRKYWPDVGRRWSNIANKYMVFTTSSEHQERHDDFVNTTTLPVDVYYLKPLWKGI